MASRWSALTGRELLRQAWWRPLPGVVLGTVLLALAVNPVIGAVAGVIAWLATLGFNALLVGDSPFGPFHRRPWQ